jgi:hypothetical protein
LGRKILVRGVGANGFGLNGMITGRYAAAFNEGGEAIGYASFVFGDHCTASDYYGTAGGFYTKNHAHTTFLYGTKCIADKGVKNSFGGGEQIHIYKGFDNFLWGRELNCSGDYNGLFGHQNTIQGHYNLVGGDNNTIGSSYNLVGGVNHTIEYNEEKTLSGRNLISGLSNTIKEGWCVGIIGANIINKKGNYCFLTGEDISNEGNNNILLGKNIKSNGASNVLIGTSLMTNGKYSSNTLLGKYLTTSHGACTLVGYQLQSGAYGQTVLGKYNAPSNNSFVVGGGSSEENKKNIFEVTAKGKAIATEVETGAVILKSPNGAQFKITINNNGELITTEVK